MLLLPHDNLPSRKNPSNSLFSLLALSPSKAWEKDTPKTRNTVFGLHFDFKAIKVVRRFQRFKGMNFDKKKDEFHRTKKKIKEDATNKQKPYK